MSKRKVNKPVVRIKEINGDQTITAFENMEFIPIIIDDQIMGYEILTKDKRFKKIETIFEE